MNFTVSLVHGRFDNKPIIKEMEEYNRQPKLKEQ
jgi:hypothetical protein